jgi:hypothetical protein
VFVEPTRFRGEIAAGGQAPGRVCGSKLRELELWIEAVGSQLFGHSDVEAFAGDELPHDVWLRAILGDRRPFQLALRRRLDPRVRRLTSAVDNFVTYASRSRTKKRTARPMRIGLTVPSLINS